MKENRLWYTAPAAEWNEATPLGNGILGMMVFGGVNEERIQLNEETFWSGWECDEYDNPKTLEHRGEINQLIFEGKYTEAQEMSCKYYTCRGVGTGDRTAAYGAYQTAGDLYIKMPGVKDSDYRRTLIIDEGRAEIKCDGTKREYFVSYKYNTAVVRITGLPDCPEVRFERENTTIVHDENDIYAEGYLPNHFALRFHHEYTDGTLTVFITAATAYKTDLNPKDVCRDTIDKAIAAGYDELRRDNIEYFSEMMGRATISFPESGTKEDVPTNLRLAEPENDIGLTELYYNFGRYLLISSSRGKLPANLQGIWAHEYLPPWSADFHININLQMNYWFAEVCNLPELLTPFFNYIHMIAKAGEHTARVAYGCPGWVTHHSTNPWGYTSLGANPIWGIFTPAGAWCLRHVKERFLHSGDKEILREFYDDIRGASEFFCAYLVKDPRNGWLVTSPASSPENSFISPTDGKQVTVCAGPTMDASIIRELFEFNIEAAEILGRDADFVKELKEKVQKLPPLRIGRLGQVMEWSEDFEEFEPGHRHISNLYGLHPGNEIRQSTPELFAAARKTIERRLAHGGGHQGWSRAWIINFFARLADGNAAHENFLALLKRSTLPNMFDNHPPFQIDGNFGGTAGVAEMLMQSHDGCVDLLPALPDAWSAGEFNGFIARGGLTVSAKWEKGKVVFAEIVGKDGQPFRVKLNGEMIDAVGRFDYTA